MSLMSAYTVQMQMLLLLLYLFYCCCIYVAVSYLLLVQSFAFEGIFVFYFLSQAAASNKSPDQQLHMYFCFKRNVLLNQSTKVKYSEFY